MKSFLKGFFYAGRGILFALKERNIRIHLFFTVYLFYFLFRYDFFEINKTQLAVLVLTCSAVLSLECINTAIENAVDLATSNYNKFAMIAKDCAAGAVLISAVSAVIIGVIILYQPIAFNKMFVYFSEKPMELVLLFITAIMFVIFIFKCKSKQNKE